MTDYGLVSIITPSYNSAEFIAETINSILAQTYTNWELLITDDCSSDNTCVIIEQFASEDTRIKLFRLSENSGAGVARNKSIKEAKGRFIAFCDSDDCWLPEKLEKQLEFMVSNAYVLTYTSYIQCNKKGEPVRIVNSSRKVSYYGLIRDNKIGCLTAIYDTKIIGKIYMPVIRKRQDWGLWLLIVKKCRFAFGLLEPLALYRMREGSISAKKMDLISYNINVYKQVLHFSMFKSYLTFYLLFMPTYIFKKAKIKLDAKR